ncbi:MAG: substrate-binding domain-containing protein [Paracoccaceae bacterium]
MNESRKNKVVSMKPVRAAKVTIQDLSDYLNLSKGTVSRALNKYPDIAASTQLRVANAAKKLGYRPSSYAQAIRTGLVKSVGLVLNVAGENAHRPFLADFLNGISQRLGEDDWTLVVATAQSDEHSVEVHSRLIAEQKVDGFILPRTKVNDPRVELLRSKGMPFVLYGRVADTTNCAWFDVSGEHAMEQAVDRLHRFGHNRIAFVGGHVDNNFALLRRDGYLIGLAKAGVEIDDSLIVEGAMSVEKGFRAATKLLSLPNPPTAIVCALDRAALGVCRAAMSLGLFVGRDVSVIGYDGIPEGAYVSPPLTTFSVDSEEAGTRLADIILQVVRGADAESFRELVDAHLIERQSDGPMTKSPKEISALVAETLQLSHGRKE